MQNENVIHFLQNVLNNLPEDWLRLTTHRLDIYHEEQAKTEFLDAFEALFQANDTSTNKLAELPTAYDYIRLGHPLSCILEWAIGKINGVPSTSVLSFSSATMPLMAVLRKNLLLNKRTHIYFSEQLPEQFDILTVQSVYGYNFELFKLNSSQEIPVNSAPENICKIFVANDGSVNNLTANKSADFSITTIKNLGSILMVNDEENADYISSIQHVRRRETIAMTPANCFIALQQLIDADSAEISANNTNAKHQVIELIHQITATQGTAIIGSSGLSVQYAIMMGLIHHAKDNFPNKPVKIVIPPNCYGGTNDQARRVAACYENVSIVDLPVDGDHDMVQSTDMVLEAVAKEDAVPYIIAEIPTNPRVEVPDAKQLSEVLSRTRKTTAGSNAIEPVFILDQTFCPNFQFLRKEGVFNNIQTIAYVSGSKFPSGGKCTAGYAVSNPKAEALMQKIEAHLLLCDNEATGLQVEILAEQMPTMNQRIQDAYVNTRDFVHFIRETLPEAKINFVSDELAEEGFTPSVFSLDLPTKGDSHEEREAYKRKLNLKLIDLMITQIPYESKYCVSYGQLKGCYWTIPATSTQGTTKEADKDYIARVSVSPQLDLEKHKEVFKEFVATM
jgi:cystathionine beta-lyase/cystathionine gamma-synthase